MMEKKKTIKIIVAIVIICAVLAVLGGIFGPDIMYHLKNRGAARGEQFLYKCGASFPSCMHPH